MALLVHVRKGDWSRLEDEWTELILGSASIDSVLPALVHAARRRELPRLLPLVREHADVLAGSERAAEAAQLLGTAMLEGGSPGELQAPLYRAAERAWSHEPWWEPFTTLAGLEEGAADMRAAWRRFQQLLALKDARAVYHATGWGVGEVREVDFAASEVHVRFASGRSDRIPLASAVEIFEVLSEGDPRALVVLDPDRLKAMLRQEPLEVLRGVLARLGGSATHAQLKIAFAGLGVEGTGFAAYWRRARKAADADPWFEISGTGTKATARILDAEADPAALFRRQLERASDLQAALRRVREVVSGGEDDEALREAALGVLERRAADPDEPLADRLAVLLFLRDAHGATPEPLAALLRDAADAPPPETPGDPPRLWEVLVQVPGLREQERAIELLQEVRGPGWLDDAAIHLVHAAPGMARALVDALAGAGREAELRDHYAALLLRPMRNPSLLVALVERLDHGGAIEGQLPPVQRANALLQLAVQLERLLTNDPHYRARQRLATLFATGGSPLLPRLLSDATPDDLRRLNRLVVRGVAREIDRLFTQIVVERAPEVFRGGEKPFWEGDTIWTTRAGLAKREEELRVLRDVKIPENSEAIGKAASYGDLSENSEWESAIEEQRNLTTRAAALEAEVRVAALLENAPLPEGVVCPGTRVTYRQDGTERTIRLLGPWDADGEDDVVSYRSPLATGMLGLREGDDTSIELPTGTVTVEIVAVEVLDL